MKESTTENAVAPMPRKSKSLAQQASQWLLAAVQAGRYLPGDKLPSENELAKEFGISRTIVREALASLKNDNILEAKQGKGIVVKDPQGRKAFRFTDVFETISQGDVHHLYEMRAILEAEAAGLAALRLSEEDRAQIVAGLEALTVAVAEKMSGEEAHDLYNEAIAKASHNPMLIEFLRFLKAQLRTLSKELRLNTMMSPERAKLVLKEHEAIVEAIFSGDQFKAKAAVLEHLQNAAGRAGLKIYTM